MNFEKLKSEFATRRCEQVAESIDIKDNSSCIIKKLTATLDEEQKKLLMEYIDEVNYSHSVFEEEIYMAGFGDGILMINNHRDKYCR